MEYHVVITPLRPMYRPYNYMEPLARSTLSRYKSFEHDKIVSLRFLSLLRAAF